MIKANELRVGNYLTTNRSGLVKVELIHDKHFDCRSEMVGFIPNGNYEPIPITKEWVSELGFVFEGGGCYCKDNFTVKIWDYGDIDFHYCGIEIPTCMESIFEIDVKYKYVHQLQNLYFALTGEELSTSRRDGEKT